MAFLAGKKMCMAASSDDACDTAGMCMKAIEGLAQAGCTATDMYRDPDHPDDGPKNVMKETESMKQWCSTDCLKAAWDMRNSCTNHHTVDFECNGDCKTLRAKVKQTCAAPHGVMIPDDEDSSVGDYLGMGDLYCTNCGAAFAEMSNKGCFEEENTCADWWNSTCTPLANNVLGLCDGSEMWKDEDTKTDFKITEAAEYLFMKSGVCKHCQGAWMGFITHGKSEGDSPYCSLKTSQCDNTCGHFVKRMHEECGDADEWKAADGKSTRILDTLNYIKEGHDGCGEDPPPAGKCVKISKALAERTKAMRCN